MLKQSPSRNQRSKGFKVKHFLQICVLLAICFWLLNQLKHSHDEKAYEDSTGNISDKVQSEHGVIKLGRKDLHPRVDETTLEGESQLDKAELEEEIEDIKLSEDVDDDGRGGGDDEIDGHDQDRAEEEEPEEVEDLIDVDDRERDVGIEEQESEEKSNPLVGANSLNDQAKNAGVRNTREAREENYKGDDGSSSVMHSRTLSTKIEIGSLRKIKVAIESGDKNSQMLIQSYPL